MKRIDRQLRKQIKTIQKESCNAEHLQQAIRISKAAFYEGEAEDWMTGAEFLYQQAGYIRKRWWVIQGILLGGLWMLLKYSAMGSGYTQKLMGISAPLFVLLLLPELWKNRITNATEVEGTAYYSLRQVYSARLLLFAIVDSLMLFAFGMAAVQSGRVVVEEIMIHFLLPLTVTCCICFRTLYSKRPGIEVFSMFLCVLWSGIWLQIVLNEKLYEAVAVPVWYMVLAGSCSYLLYCIWRGQRGWRRIWE